MSDAEMRTMLANLMRDQSDGQREARDAVVNGGSTYHSTAEVIRAMLAAEAAAIERCVGLVENGIMLAHDGSDLTGFERSNSTFRNIATAIRSLKEGASHVG